MLDAEVSFPTLGGMFVSVLDVCLGTTPWDCPDMPGSQLNCLINLMKIRLAVRYLLGVVAVVLYHQ